MPLRFFSRAVTVLAAALCACQSSPDARGPQPDLPPDTPLDSLLEGRSASLDTVLRDPEKYRVQVLYTQINRDARNRPSFTSFLYRVDPDEYHYPASTVKLPTALVALEKLGRLDIAGLDRDTTMLTGADGELQTPALVDPTSPSGLPSVGQYIRKILLVSDNDAYNRLYEFVGPDELNAALAAKGYGDTRIFHRLSVARTPEENRRTNPIRFVDGDVLVYEQPARTSSTDYAAEAPVLLGRAEIIDGQRVEGPKDFAGNNRFALEDCHDVVKAVMFPDAVAAERRFDLSAGDLAFVRQYMSMYPGESGIPAYADEASYPDAYVKLLMYGGDAEEIPRHIRIFNKTGDAYGFLTDCAYIVDFEHEVEFLLAATVYTNENQTFNDDDYEYDETGKPFLRELGQAIYDYELRRERRHAPDLSSLESLRGESGSFASR